MSGKANEAVCRCVVALFALIVIIAVYIIVLVLHLIPSHDPFKFEVNFLEAKTRRTFSSSLPQTGLDANVTLSVNTRYPVLFGMVLASLRYDDKQDQTVLASMKLDDVSCSNKTNTMNFGMSTRNFTRKEDNLDLQVTILGQYVALGKGKEVNTKNFKISCKGIKVVLVSSLNYITVSTGRMLGGPISCK